MDELERVFEDIQKAFSEMIYKSMKAYDELGEKIKEAEADVLEEYNRRKTYEDSTPLPF